VTLQIISGPADLPVSVAEAKANMRVETSDEDALIEGMIRAALAHAERWCGRAFVTQVWEQVLDEFPAAEIDLGLGPVVSVDSVKYDDADGVEQTVAAQDYVVDTVSGIGWVVPVEGFSWPTTMETVNAVRVRFTVGSVPSSVWYDVRQAILLIVGHWYAHREDASADEAKPIPMGAAALLNLHRRMFV
jgi:uncharacterized phiE125 gp8 family phage protein